ncbi:MAG: acyl carrier protein [Acidisphaera sp.]|nr:acyl carrier protein [Acidisphaera sp.]
MHREEIYAGLAAVFREVFGAETLALTPGLSARDVEGWDSITHIDLVVAIERRFGLRMRSREIEQLATVDDIVRLIETKAGQQVT